MAGQELSGKVKKGVRVNLNTQKLIIAAFIELTHRQEEIEVGKPIPEAEKSYL